MSRTLFDRVWDAHVVRDLADGVALLYVDLHLVHEVTSPQAFAGLKREKRSVRRPERTLATVDHNVPTGERSVPIADPVAARLGRSPWVLGRARSSTCSRPSASCSTSRGIWKPESRGAAHRVSRRRT